jgi:hypothetical protein
MRSIRETTNGIQTMLMLMIDHCTTSGTLLLIISANYSSFYDKRYCISTVAQHLNCCCILDVLERNAIRRDDSVIRSENSFFLRY